LQYLNQLNPNDVGSVDILKGAAATAIYGNEAFNGAIIITTKKGARGKGIINVSSTVTWEAISILPKLQNEFGSYGGEGLDPQGRSTYIPYENQSYGPRYDGSIVPVGDPVRIFNPDGTFQMLLIKFLIHPCITGYKNSSTNLQLFKTVFRFQVEMRQARFSCL